MVELDRIAGRQDLFLSTLAPSAGQRRLALIAALACALAFAAAAPFARTQLPPAPAFIAVYQSILIISDVITAILLFGQLGTLRSPALLVLAGGYLFTAIMAGVHMLTFPGLFAPTGLLGANQQTTAWLYMFWHAGFPLAVAGYSLLKRRPVEGEPGARFAAMVVPGLVAVLALAGIATLAATAGAALLPPIMNGNSYTAAMIFVTTSTWAFSLFALAVLWRRRPYAVLDLWLMVVMCAWIFDIALSAVLNGGRYDLGFYVGRLNGLLAASFVLTMLLGETLTLYRRLVAANAQLSNLANRDGLTGLYNRRALDAHLRDELSRAQRLRQEISVLLIDVDNFKQFNDAYGHLDGDAALREIAGVLGKTANRPGDMAARFGGDEFVVVLATATAAGAEQVGERTRAAIANLAIPHRENPTGAVTVSVGVATIPARAGMTADDLIEIADRALYTAKSQGRNTVAGGPRQAPEFARSGA